MGQTRWCIGIESIEGAELYKHRPQAPEPPYNWDCSLNKLDENMVKHIGFTAVFYKRILPYPLVTITIKHGTQGSEFSPSTRQSIR